MQPSFVRVEFEYPDQMDSSASAPQESPRLTKWHCGHLSTAPSLPSRSPRQFESGYDWMARSEHGDVAHGTVSVSDAADTDNSVWTQPPSGKGLDGEGVLSDLGILNGMQNGDVLEKESVVSDSPVTGSGAKPRSDTMLLDAMSEVVIRTKISDLMKFLKSETVADDKTGPGHIHSPNCLPHISQEMAEFYFLGNGQGARPMEDAKAFADMLQRGTPQLGDSGRPKTSRKRGKPASTTSILDAAGSAGGTLRNLLLLKFATKYTDYRVSTQWLSVLLKHPYGKKLEMVNRYIDRNRLRSVFDQYVDAHLKTGDKPPAHFWPLDLHSEFKEFTLHKLMRMTLGPREYRKRKHIWHTVLNHLDAYSGTRDNKIAEAPDGYKIHACPGTVDMKEPLPVKGEFVVPAGSARPSAELTNKEAWTARKGETYELVSALSLYIKRLQPVQGHVQTELLESLSKGIAGVIETPFPSDRPGAITYSCSLIRLADSFYRFWVDEQSYFSGLSGEQALTVDRGIQHEDNTEQCTQTSGTVLVGETYRGVECDVIQPVCDVVEVKILPEIVQMSESAPFKATESPAASATTVLTNPTRFPPVPPAPHLSRPISPAERISECRISEPYIVKTDGLDVLSDLATAPLLSNSRKAPLNDRFIQSGWILPPAPEDHSPTTLKCDADSPDAAPEACPVSFKVLDIQDSGELLVLEDKGSELDTAATNGNVFQIDYSGVVEHPLYSSVKSETRIGETAENRDLFMVDAVPEESFDVGELEDIQQSSFGYNLEVDQTTEVPEEVAQISRLLEIPEELEEAMSEMSMYHDAFSSHEVTTSFLESLSGPETEL